LSRSPRIGLFGGTFDPPHRAHLALAQVALQTLALDELRWIPAGQPWQKAGRRLADAEHRCAMVQALFAGEPRFVLDRRELHRAGPSYTVDTARELAAERPGAELFLVIGQDQYARFDTWREWQSLLGLVTLAVAAREGQAPRPPEALQGVAHRAQTLPLPTLRVSSTAARAAAARGQALSALPALTGAEVARYIEHHRLYRKEAAAH